MIWELFYTSEEADRLFIVKEADDENQIRDADFFLSKCMIQCASYARVWTTD